MNDVTLVITSCNRPFLLKPTLESFMKYNTYPIKECIIIEDSGLQGINDFTKETLKEIPLKLIYNEKNLGQLKSIDIAYSQVKTEYIFHCEEDWEFIEYGFIEKSMKLLSLDEKIFTVWLRPYNCTSGHPIIEMKELSYNIMKKDFSYYDKGVKYTWYGITFNPGLRRTDVCLKYHPYSEIKKYESSDTGGEYSVNVAYGKDGFYSVIDKKPSGYVKHIGWNYHIRRNWE
jgi:hypothetical protein